MKTLMLNASEALELHAVGGYEVLRAEEPIATVVDLGAEMWPWITFIAPHNKIWGMQFRISDTHSAKEGAVFRDAEMQRYIKTLFPPLAICSLAPPSVVQACVGESDESVHAELQGYYHLSPVVLPDGREAKDVIQGAETWLLDFPQETIGNMDDAALENAGWLSLRSESQRTYALLLFSSPSLAQGMRGGATVDQIVEALEKALEVGVSLNSLQVDPRFLRVPKFSLGLMSIAMAPKRIQPRLIQIAELRARLVEKLDSPLLFDDVAAERLRMDDEYKSILGGVQNTKARICAALDCYVSRWEGPLDKAVIV